MKKTCETTSTIGEEDLRRRQAGKGDLFWAVFRLSDGVERRSPVLIVGTDNDPADVIACKCTLHPPRTAYDICIGWRGGIQCVRTNKIYTLERAQMLHSISYSLTRDEASQVASALREALGI